MEKLSALGRFKRRLKEARRHASDAVARADAKNFVRPTKASNPQRQYRLNEISIELTSKCNLSCQMCSVWKGGRDGLPGPVILDLLAQARQLGARVFTASGAEALMRRDTLAILEAAADLGYRDISVISNGALLKRNAVRLAGVRGLRIGVSVDGPEDVHDDLRGEGSYRAAVEGVRAVRDKGVAVHLCAVLMRPTIETAGHVIDLAVRLKLSEVAFQPFQPEIAWAQDDHARWQFDPDQRAMVEVRLGDLVARARSEGIRISTQGIFPVMPGYFFDGVRPIPMNGCAMPSRFLLINERGDTYPCFFMRGQSMGNVRQGVRLRDIWHGPVQQTMQRRGFERTCPGCLASCSDTESYNSELGLFQ